jgi:regulator of G-protein signaling
MSCRVEIPTERRVKKWGISMEDLVFDPTGWSDFSFIVNHFNHKIKIESDKTQSCFTFAGLREFTAYLKKEYCHENIRFWLAVRDLRFGPICQLRGKAQQIYK